MRDYFSSVKCQSIFFLVAWMLFSTLKSEAAESIEVQFPRAKWGWQNIQEGVLDNDHLVINGIHLGELTLGKVKDKLGNASTFKAGEMNYSPEARCYRWETSTGGKILAFEAGPLGGWTEVSAITVSKSRYFPYQQHCSRPSAKISGVTKSGIAVGISKQALIDILGTPSYEEPTVAAFRYRSKKYLEKNEIEKFAEIWGDSVVENPYLVVSTGVEAFFEEDSLGWYRVYRELSH